MWITTLALLGVVRPESWMWRPPNLAIQTWLFVYTTTSATATGTTTTCKLCTCRSGWNPLLGTNTCFKIITPGGYPTFDEARDGCSKISSHLVRIDSEATNNQISRTHSPGIWIGGMGKTEGHWTDTKGRELTYFNWASNQPDDDDEQNCVYTNYGQNGNWDDLWCDNRHSVVTRYACQYECEHETPTGWCHASGDPHYITYDGVKFDFMGTCRYLLTGVKAGCGTADMPWFEVEVQHRQAWSTSVTMTEHVWLHFNSTNSNGTDMKYTIYMKIAEPSRRPSKIATEIIEHYGDSSVTIMMNELRNDKFTMVNYGNRVVVTTWFGVRVEYAASDWTVDVHIPECYGDCMEGLCGNYNGDRSDEYTDKDRIIYTNVAAWGQSWQTAWEGGDCDRPIPPIVPPCTDQQVLTDCQKMIDTNEIFAPCASANGVLALTFYDNCVFDVCLESEIKCGKFEQFAQQCFRELAGVMENNWEICSWANHLGCAPECGANSVYTGCADSCRDMRTCGNRHDSIAHCPTSPRFVSMCVCNDGFVLENGQCIPEAECGCQTPNGGSVANGYQFEDCQKACTCIAGNYKCETLLGCRATTTTNIAIPTTATTRTTIILCNRNTIPVDAGPKGYWDTCTDNGNNLQCKHTCNNGLITKATAMCFKQGKNMNTWKIHNQSKIAICDQVQPCSTSPENKYPIGEGGTWECEQGTNTKCSIKCPNGYKAVGGISCHATKPAPNDSNNFNANNWIIPSKMKETNFTCAEPPAPCSTNPEVKFPIAGNGTWNCQRGTNTKCSIQCPHGNTVSGKIYCHKKKPTPNRDNNFNEDNWIVPKFVKSSVFSCVLPPPPCEASSIKTEIEKQFPSYTYNSKDFVMNEKIGNLLLSGNMICPTNSKKVASHIYFTCKAKKNGEEVWKFKESPMQSGKVKCKNGK